MPLENGSLIYGRYRIIDILGKGGMGAVYRAIDESLGVQIALKENLIEDEEALRQFRREATILANMRHPNLPRVTDHFVIDDQGQYLVMDYIEGEDLRVRLERSGPIPEEQVILIGSSICDALQYLHTLNPQVLHRDLKPGNIKVTPSGQVFLVDFGLAKIVQGSQQTTTGARGLTPGYSPPEQYGTARTDARSDVYSLGATLYAALTGVQPEDALSIAINQATLTKIRDRKGKITPKVAEVIEKSISPQPEDRYQSAADFKQAMLEANDSLRKRLEEGGVTKVSPPPSSFKTTVQGDGIDPDTATRRQPPLARRNIPMLIAAGIAVVAVVLGAVFLGPQLLSSGGQANNGSTLPIATDQEVGLATIAADLDSPTHTPSSLLPTMTAMPTETPLPIDTPTPEATPMGGGQLIAFASTRDGIPQIYLVDVSGGDPVQLTSLDAGACQPTWSPDGQRLIFISPCRRNTNRYDGASLFMINLDGAGLAQVPGTSPVGDFDPDWSPDGSQIVFTSLRDSNRPQIWVIDMSSGEATSLSDSVSHDYMPSWSPDGLNIIFVTTRLGPTEIWYMDASGRPWEYFSRSPELINIDPVWSPDGETIMFTQLSSSNSHIKLAYWEEGGRERGFTEFRLSNEIYGMREPDFSPDGTWVVLVGNPEGENHDIYILSITGSEIIQLTFDPSLDFDPAWQPLP